MSHLLKASTHVFLGLIFLSFAAVAQQSGEDSDQRPGRRGPPPESIQACSNSSEAESCSFEGRHGDEMAGQCVAMRDSDELHCRPEGRRPRRGEQARISQ